MNRKNLTYPTIHLNGSDGATLRQGIFEAELALQTAVGKLYDCAPHGRDYYPQGNAAYSKASREHMERINKLNEVLQELTYIRHHITKFAPED